MAGGDRGDEAWLYARGPLKFGTCTLGGGGWFSNPRYGAGDARGAYPTAAGGPYPGDWVPGEWGL